MLGLFCFGLRFHQRSSRIPPEQAPEHQQLKTGVSPKSKLTKPVRKPKATRVEPTFVADIEYRDITSEGLVRASSFKGWSRK
jgi:ATP-dependent DNA ligase